MNIFKSLLDALFVIQKEWSEEDGMNTVGEREDGFNYETSGLEQAALALRDNGCISQEKVELLLEAIQQTWELLFGE